MDATLSIACPAKLNLALSVGPPLPDDDPRHPGLHPLCSWMLAIDLCDTLRVRLPGGGAADDAQTPPLRITFADDAPAPHDIDWPLESDLAYRAWRSLEKHVGRSLPMTATLEKRIPAGAGLGGGSADAAGMLVALNQLHNLSLNDATLNRIAHTLGSDVPFALGAIQGHAAAIVEGVGEKLEPVALKTPIHAALILPAFHCETAAIYCRFDAMQQAQGLNPQRVRQLATADTHHAHDWFNDLAEPACHAQPRLRELLDRLADALGPQRAHVTGSGSAVFVPCPDANAAQAAALQIAPIVEHPVIAVRSQSQAEC